MAASLRELRQRRNSVSATKKITQAMELIAASRITKAQQRARAAAPYSRELTRAVSAVASLSDVEHPLTTDPVSPTRAAMLLITADQGLAGAYSTNALKRGDQLVEHLHESNLEVDTYLTGRKGVDFYQFRSRPVVESWQGFSQEPTYTAAREIAHTLLDAFLRPTEEGGVDEIHIVYTQYVSRISQQPEVLRLLPLEVVEAEEPVSADELHPLYDFEPNAQEVMDALLPLYIASRIQYCLLQSAASELASKQTAMKAATDNAQELIEDLTRQANQARQAQITQEISEITGGAAALAESSAESE